MSLSSFVVLAVDWTRSERSTAGYLMVYTVKMMAANMRGSAELGRTDTSASTRRGLGEGKEA